MGQAPHFEPRFIDYALNNLHVKKGDHAHGDGDGAHDEGSKRL
jgi:hypothetical protein